MQGVQSQDFCAVSIGRTRKRSGLDGNSLGMGLGVANHIILLMCILHDSYISN